MRSFNKTEADMLSTAIARALALPPNASMRLPVHACSQYLWTGIGQCRTTVNLRNHAKKRGMSFTFTHDRYSKPVVPKRWHIEGGGITITRVEDEKLKSARRELPASWPGEPMKALSTKQPYAYMLAAGHQTVDNRSWSTDFRGRFYIHASLASVPLAEYQRIRRRLDKIIIADGGNPYIGGFAESFYMRQFLGVIVGEATLVDVVTESDSPWFTGPFGFVLEDPVLYWQQLSWKGQRRWFSVDLPASIRRRAAKPPSVLVGRYGPAIMTPMGVLDSDAAVRRFGR